MQRMCNLNRSNKKGIRQNKKIYQELGYCPFEIDDDVENIAFFVRSWKIRVLNISSS